MKKKILFFIPTLGHGGAEKVLVNLVNNLDQSKFDITVQTIFDDGVNKEFLNSDVRYKYSLKRTFRGFSHLLKILSPKQLHTFLIKEEYDIEVAFLEAVSTRIISGCNNQNTLLISWIHCTMHNKKEASIGYRSWKESVIAYEKFNRIVCVSQAVETAFNKLYGMNLKTTYVYNINESDHIRMLSKMHSDDTNIIDNRVFNICAVGKIIEVKGFDRLARIQKKLVDQGYSTHVYILGTGNKQSEISEFVKNSGIQKQWSFLGYKKNPYEWIEKCDLFVCSSRSEGLSTAVTEALLIGIPIITTDVSGMRELLEDGRSGMIVDNDEECLYEGIKKVIDDTELLSQLRTKSRKRGNDFIKEKIILDIEKVLLS